MRVGQTGNNQVQGTDVKSTRHTAKAKAGEAASGAERAASTDGASASISSKAKDMATAKAAASDAPDVREERIAELKRRISEGNYHVDSHAVADRMVDDHLKSGIG